MTSEIKSKVRAIAVQSIIRTNFYKPVIFKSNDGKDIKDLSIFFKLRKYPETGRREWYDLTGLMLLLVKMK